VTATTATALSAASTGKRSYTEQSDDTSRPTANPNKKQMKGKGQRGGKLCSCGKKGHAEENCFLIHPDRVSERIKKLRLDAEKRQFFAYFGSPTCAYVTSHRALGAAPSQTLLELQKDQWIFDSGASGHMCNDETSFTTYTAFLSDEKHEVELGDGTCIPALGFGTVKLVSCFVLPASGTENSTFLQPTDTIVCLRDHQEKKIPRGVRDTAHTLHTLPLLKAPTHFDRNAPARGNVVGTP
jgi:hypothetical protein